jgi:hypothetical protein
MRVLVCGSRTWDDRFPVVTVLDGLLESAIVLYDRLTIIEGCAIGADWFACHFYDGPCVLPSGGSHASHTSVDHEHYPADWSMHGKGAGPIRNQRMLDEGKPDVVFAFTDDLEASRGTADMVRRAKSAGLPVYVVGRA